MKRVFVCLLSVFLILLFANVGLAKKLDEKKLIKSANKVVEQWQAVLSKSISTATFNKDYWIAGKYFFSEKIKYDVKKTDSILSPYKLLITVGYRFGIVPPFKKNQFKSCDEAYKASADKSVGDLYGTDESKHLNLVYAVKDNSWQLTDETMIKEITCFCCKQNQEVLKLIKLPIK